MRQLLLTAVLLAFFVCCLGRAFAAESATGFPNCASHLDIDGHAGTISGEFLDCKVGDVLAMLGQRYRLQYHVEGAPLGVKVSGRFGMTPLAQALRMILTGYSYVVRTDESGRIRDIWVVARNALAERKVLRPLASKPVDVVEEVDSNWNGSTAGPDAYEAIPQEDVPPEFRPTQAAGTERTGPVEVHSRLTEGDRRAFEAGSRSREISEELLRAFAPVQPPGTARTGPLLPEGDECTGQLAGSRSDTGTCLPHLID